MANKNVEIRIETQVRTNINIYLNRLDILVHDKKRKDVVLIEVGIAVQDRLVTIKTEKKRKYNVLANNLGQENICKTKIIPCVLT